TPRPRCRRDRRGLADGSSVPHLLCTAHAVRRGRQLQHRCVLAFIEPSDQHGLSIREFERIVMHVRFVCVDLPKTSYLAANCLFTLPRYENAKPALGTPSTSRTQPLCRESAPPPRLVLPQRQNRA